MGKNKLAKFADMARYPNVVESPGVPQPDKPFPLCGHWHEQFFHNDNPIVLELGCGRGEYTVGLARLYPDKNFIGVDIKGARMWAGATESLQERLTNVGFLRTRIEFIDACFAAGEVSEIWLTFSDPQMKKVTKRLTSTYFLTRYRRFLVDGGLIHVKTDSNFLFTYTKAMIDVNALPTDYATADLYHAFSEDVSDDFQRILGIKTYYEAQWMARGIAIKYLKFHLPAAGALQEPDIEIELDDYRSFNRSKRSGLERSK